MESSLSVSVSTATTPAARASAIQTIQRLDRLHTDIGVTGQTTCVSGSGDGAGGARLCLGADQLHCLVIGLARGPSPPSRFSSEAKP
jgi:hypothetical protein